MHVIVYSLPTVRGMGSLKHIKDIKPFKELRITLVKGFIVELMIATRPLYLQAHGSVLFNVIGM